MVTKTDYITTAEMAQLLEFRADAIAKTDPKFSAQLFTAAHFLRIYAALESTYRQKLGGDFDLVVNHVNKLFKKDQIG